MSPRKQKVLKWVDRNIGKVLVRLFSFCRCNLQKRKDKLRDSKKIRVLVIRPGGLGDAILLTPGMRFFKEKIKEIFQSKLKVEIHYLGEKRNIEGAKLCYGDIVEEFVIYDSWDFPLFLLKNAKKYDFVIDTEQSFVLPSVVGRILGKNLIGFSVGEKRKLEDVSVPYSFSGYEAEEFFKLFSACVIRIREKLRAEETTSSGEHGTEEENTLTPDNLSPLSSLDILPYFRLPESISNKLKEGGKNTKFDIVFAPFTTRWEKTYDEFSSIIEHFRKKGLRVKVLGDSFLPIIDVVRIVIGAKVFVSVDNGIMHFRVFSPNRERTLVIFGPTNHLKWANPHFKVLREYLYCSPCSHFAEIPKCPREKKCMKDIDEKMVIREIERMLRE